MDSSIVSDLPPAVMTREEARAAGLKFYTPAKPCRRGHMGPYYVSAGLCKPCHEMRIAKSKSVRRRCIVEGCDEPIDTKDYCKCHYARWKRHGDPLAGNAPPGTGLKWLKDNVGHQGDDCLIWPFNKGTYANVKVDGKQLGAHAYMCFLVHGEKPGSNYVAAHSCGKGHKGCLNPQHLRWKTHAENSRDMAAHGTLMIGEDSPFSKLTDDEVRQIRALKGTMTQREIGKMFGVTRGAIAGIHRGKTWYHLD